MSPPDDEPRPGGAPEYKVYGSRRADGERDGGGGSPEYKVYRSGRGFSSLLGRADLGGLLERKRKPWRRRRGPGTTKPRWRRWGKWVAIAVVGWLLISFAVFALSAQLQSGKLDNNAASVLGGGPFMFASPQTVLVVGTDARPPGTKEPGAAMSPKCYGQQAVGSAPSSDCQGHPTDTMMLIRAGGGVFRKLSIPRDSLADIPGYAPQKINAAYALGGAQLTVKTVEAFLGVHIDHIVIVDFKGFEDFINAIGGVTVNVPEQVCSEISGGTKNGGFTLNLSKGQHSMNGIEALSYARTRKNSCDPAYNDINREQAQQAVIAGIKGQLTDPLRLPYNFVMGPVIGWDAPRAFVSDMGAWTMPQLLLSAAIGGTSGGDGVCKARDSGCNLGGPNFEIIVPKQERQRAAGKLLHG